MAEGKSVEYNHIKGIKELNFSTVINIPTHEAEIFALPMHRFRAAVSREYKSRGNIHTIVLLECVP